jgi:hypothetical protein
MGNLTPVRGGGLIQCRVIMMIMCVLEEEFLCQGLMGWIPVLECLFVRCV